MGAALLVLGAGGHALVCRSVVVDSGEYSFRGFISETCNSTAIPSTEIAGNDELLESLDSTTRPYLHAGIGANSVRRALQEKFEGMGFYFPPIISPSATVALGVTVGDGAIIMPGAIINSGTTVGRGCIVNTGCIVDHESAIGDFSHVGPGATLCGKVRVNTGSFVGAGSVIIENLVMGAYSVIGAGSVVIRNVPDSSTVAGVPATAIS